MNKTIYVNGRPVQVDATHISFGYVLELWRRQDPENRSGYVEVPGIDWHEPDGDSGVLYPHDPAMVIVDGLSFQLATAVAVPVKASETGWTWPAVAAVQVALLVVVLALDGVWSLAAVGVMMVIATFAAVAGVLGVLRRIDAIERRLGL